jgi:hypothetical protein
MSRLVRRSLFLFSAIVATLAIGTVGFTWIAGYPPFDAFYMALNYHDHGWLCRNSSAQPRGACL